MLMNPLFTRRAKCPDDLRRDGVAEETPLVIHIVPLDAIGGVETAARSLSDGVYDGLHFRKYYLGTGFSEIAGAPNAVVRPRSLNAPWTYLQAFRELRRERPRVVIASLWRSCALLIAIKFLWPSTRTVTFLHSAVDVHWLDRCLNRWAMRLSDAIWADSQATLDARVPSALLGRARVISFVLQQQAAPSIAPLRPSFAFWGRLHWQKGLHHALRVFAGVHLQHTGAVFHIIGPDDGQRASLMAEAERLGVADAVQFMGALPQDAIFRFVRSNCSFYLQTSVDEGMALSVVEAMTLGLVPVVTPVGEIARYCHDGVNAVLVEDDSNAAAQRILRLLSNPGEFRDLSRAAAASWQGKPLYRDDVLEASRVVAGVCAQTSE